MKKFVAALCVLLVSGCLINNEPIKPLTEDVRELLVQRQLALAKHKTMYLEYAVRNPNSSAKKIGFFVWEAPDRYLWYMGEEIKVYTNGKLHSILLDSRRVEILDIEVGWAIGNIGWMIPSKLEDIAEYREATILENGDENIRLSERSILEFPGETTLRKSDFVPIRFVEADGAVWTLEKAEFDFPIKPDYFKVEIPDGFLVREIKSNVSTQP